MFNFYSPLVHHAHHFIAGPLALNTKILQYGTTKDQLSQVALMDRLLTVLGLCYGSRKEGDRTPCNMAWDDFITPRALATSGRRPGVRAKRAARGVAGRQLWTSRREKTAHPSIAIIIGCRLISYVHCFHCLYAIFTLSYRSFWA